jgi:anaerobic magnesium-protoporphyrin IX monomethyl ester cyclase
MLDINSPDRKVASRFRLCLAQSNLSDSLDVLFLNPPVDRYGNGGTSIYKTLPPMGLGILATLTERHGLSVAILDCEAMRLSVSETVEAIDAIKPKVLGISLTSPAVAIASEICSGLNAPPILVAGGVHATVMPRQTLDAFPSVQVVFTGYAEEQWCTFCRRLLAVGWRDSQTSASVLAAWPRHSRRPHQIQY